MKLITITALIALTMGCGDIIPEPEPDGGTECPPIEELCDACYQDGCNDCTEEPCAECPPIPECPEPETRCFEKVEVWYPEERVTFNEIPCPKENQ